MILLHQSMHDQKPNILLSVSRVPWRFLLLGIIAHCDFFFLMKAWSSSCAYSASFHFHIRLIFWTFFTLLINSDIGGTWWVFSTEDADDGGYRKSKRHRESVILSLSYAYCPYSFYLLNGRCLYAMDQRSHPNSSEEIRGQCDWRTFPEMVAPMRSILELRIDFWIWLFAASTQKRWRKLTHFPASIWTSKHDTFCNLSSENLRGN